MFDFKLALGRLFFVVEIALSSAMLWAGSSPLPPLPVVDGDVYALHVQDGRLYMAGSFSSLDDGAVVHVRKGLAAIDIASGTVVLDWGPDLGGGVGGAGVARVLLPSADGKSMYVGGSFVTAGIETHGLLLEVDIDSGSSSYGQVSNWDAMLTGSSVNALALSMSSNLLYVGGDFSQVGGDFRQYLAAIDLTSFLATPWQPRPDDVIHSLLLTSDNSRLYVGGEFNVIGSDYDGRESRVALAALNTSNAAVQAWNPALIGQAVYDMELSGDEDALTVAGLFDSVGVLPRVNLAQIDTASALATTWVANTAAVAPAVDPAVYVLDVGPSGLFLVGGGYSEVSGVSSAHLAMLDIADGALLPWAPAVAVNATSKVRALAVDAATDTLFVGGVFDDVGGVPLDKNIAAFAMAPPVTVSVSPGGFASQTSLTVTLACADHSGGACVATYVTTDGSEPTTMSSVYSLPISIGITTTLKFFSVDSDGNREAVHTEIYVIDNVSPQTTTTPEPGLVNASSSSVVEVPCDEELSPGCESTYYAQLDLSCDDGVAGSGCSAINYSFDGGVSTFIYSALAPIKLLDGITELSYFSVDNAGNVEPLKTDSYNLDLTLPDISVSHDGGNYTSPLTLTVTCDDGAGSGCGYIYVSTDGVLPGPDVVPEAYSGPIDVMLDSASIIRVQVTDLAGNRGDKILGIYTFTSSVPLKSEGSGAALWLPLLLIPLVFFRWR